MSCCRSVDGNPPVCTVQRSIATALVLGAVATCALGIIALLANRGLCSFSNISIKDPGAIAMVATGGVVAITLTALMIRSCKEKRPNDKFSSYSNVQDLSSYGTTPPAFYTA